MKATWVGQPLARKEDGPLLTGRDRFLDDVPMHGLAHVAILRSPHAHARITRIDVSRAATLPGVHAVLTGEEVIRMSRPQHGRIPLPASPKVYALAHDKVLYVGQPVAAVAAEDRATAEDALDLIDVDYDPLPAVVSPEAAMAPGATVVFDELGSNVLWHDTFPYGDVEGAFQRADRVVHERITIHRYLSTPLETFGSIAQFDPSTQTVTLAGSAHQPGQEINNVAAALGLSPGQVRMIVPPMGGGFGNKTRPIYHILVALLAMKLGNRPVKWVADRRESLLALGHAADGVMDIDAAISEDGTILGLKFRNIENEGAGIDFAGRHNLLMLSNLVNCYRIPAASYEGFSVVSNSCPVIANRGIGKPFMCLAVERIVDAVARETGLNRVEVRQRNFIQPEQFPYETPSGQTYDSGDYPEMLRKALALLDYDSLVEEQARGRTEGRLPGIGIACGVEPAGSNLAYGMLISGPGQLLSGQGEAARVRMEPDGSVTVYTGGIESGQGHTTSLSQIVADELGLDPQQVRIAATFDSQSHPYVQTSGNYSNKFNGHDTAAAIGAARKIRNKLLARAARMLEASPEDLDLGNGRVIVRGAPDRSVLIAQVAARAYWSLTDDAPDDEPGLEALHYYRNPRVRTPDAERRVPVQMGFSAAAHVACVEVDPDTFEITVKRYGVVHDCGKEINPLIVEGQVHGATVHGIGAALLEEFVYDDDGQLLTTSFMDYLKPSSADVPPIETDRLETPSPWTALGTKGIGEGGAIVAPAAIASAVEDALQPLGIRITGLPITPTRLWRVARTGGSRYPA